jgi:hypothetical protein
MSEVSQLKARINQLESRLAALEPKLAPTPEPEKYREPEVRISTFVERGEFAMPDEKQSKRLLQIVQARYSALKLVGDVTERDLATELSQFRAGFWHLGHVHRRLDGLDSVGYPSYYVDIARNWLRQFGGRFGEDISIKTWLAAVVGHADIAFATQDAFTTPYGFAVGIVPIGTGGLRCHNAWKQLLAGEIRVREPLRIPVPTEKASPVRIYSGG